MATRKKKDIAVPENVSGNGWPKINQGSHLTVKTFEDGRTELVWDDEALTQDVRDAILRYEMGIPAEAESLTIRKRKTKV